MVHTIIWEEYKGAGCKMTCPFFAIYSIKIKSLSGHFRSKNGGKNGRIMLL